MLHIPATGVEDAVDEVEALMEELGEVMELALLELRELDAEEFCLLDDQIELLEVFVKALHRRLVHARLAG